MIQGVTLTILVVDSPMVCWKMRKGGWKETNDILLCGLCLFKLVMTQENDQQRADTASGPLTFTLYSPTYHQPSSVWLSLARLGSLTSLHARGSCQFTRPGLDCLIWPSRGQAAGLPYLLRQNPP